MLETGYEARYSKVWEFAREWSVRTSDIGAVVAVDAVALFDQPKGTWYASESRSGGFAVTHLSYCFLNPLRWLFGTPVVAGAVRRKSNSQADVLDGAMYSVSLQYLSGIVCSLLAGYLRPPHADPWSVTFTAEAESLRIVPGDNTPSSAARYHAAGKEELNWTDDAFIKQAKVFFSAVAGGGGTRASGRDALTDLRTAAEIETMARGAVHG